jgi:choline kinase
LKAVLLAAGRSTRLYPLTLDKPKSLLEVGGKTLLEYQLDALANCGIQELVIVTGYLDHLIETKIKSVQNRYAFAFEFIYNERFAETNNMYSLWTARESLTGGDFLCLHADVLFHPEILRAAANAEGNITLVADREILEETMKLKLNDESENQVASVGKHISMKEASGTFLGIAKFSAGGGRLLFDELDRLVKAGETNAYFTAAVEILIKKNCKVTACFTDGLSWIEIDFPEELSEAEKKVLPMLLAKSA